MARKKQAKAQSHQLSPKDNSSIDIPLVSVGWAFKLMIGLCGISAGYALAHTTDTILAVVGVVLGFAGIGLVLDVFKKIS